MAEAREAPVGVFDSGVGGLTILSELRRELPDERFIYFGDTGNCPYGVRPVSEIRELSRNAANFLLTKGAKIIVVACNTASVSALAELRATFPKVRFIGVVPAVKPAAERTREIFALETRERLLKIKRQRSVIASERPFARLRGDERA